MNLPFFPAAFAFGTLSLLVVDSAIKGLALLLLATIVTSLMWRDSAAARHLVWLTAVVAMLAVPLFSSALPRWRVLPAWSALQVQPEAAEPPSSNIEAGHELPVARPATAYPSDDWPSSTDRNPLVTERPAQPATTATAGITAVPSEPGGLRVEALPPLWCIGFSVLAMRLLAARVLLWSHERRAKVVAVSRNSRRVRAVDEPDLPIVTEFQTVCEQLGIRQSVWLLIHAERTVPVVWGVVGLRLLVPAAAREWSAEQLRSVLLHELAHIKRRDTITQLMAQLACALHWFNPLVWFAAWRLHVERERACDDLVLSNGVRASKYAEHLLDVATEHSPVHRTEACGLAMARPSLLEGRLRAVLDKRLNRRGVTTLLAAAVLVCGAAVAVPLAMLQAGDEPSADSPAAENEPAASPGETGPRPGEKLDPATEEKLQWGEPVNGLRAALSRMPSLGRPKPGMHLDFDLVVQNVSNAPIRLVANSEAPNPRTLRVRQDGSTLFGIVSNEPSQADYLLQPRAVAVLQMFSPDSDEAASIAEKPAFTFYALMQIERAPAGAWTGKLRTSEVSGAAATGAPQPKDESARPLFNKWRDSARADGTIPGGALGSLAKATANFVKFNPTDERTPQLSEVLKRIDTSRDWTQLDAVSLLDDVTAVYASLPGWAMTQTRFSVAEDVRTGLPLPAQLRNAPWGEAHASGLRVAWLLDPHAEQHRLGTPLKSRVLFHNTGKDTIVFRALTWNQSSAHEAVDANGDSIEVSSTMWTTIPQVFVCRLAPGESYEVIGAGIGVGGQRTSEDWRGTRVGAWISAQAGDAVTFTPAPVSGTDGRAGLSTKPSWWLDFITERLSRDMPLPGEGGERERLLDRAVRDLFGTPPTASETAAFVGDPTPGAFEALAKRLAQRAGFKVFTGTLQPGVTRFKVLPADPDAAKKPRVATGPGRYDLGAQVRLVIVQKSDGNRRVNEASIMFFSSNPQQPAAQPHEVKLPAGYQTWAIAWERGSTVLWAAEKGVLRSYDFADRADVKETRIETTDVNRVAEPLRDVLRSALAGDGNDSAPPAATRDR